MFGKGQETLDVKGRKNYWDCNIADISQNTEESPGDLRRFAITQTSVEAHQLMLVWKTCDDYNNNSSANSYLSFYSRQVLIIFKWISLNDKCSPNGYYHYVSNL